MNQPQVYTCHPFWTPPHPIPQGCPSAHHPWAPCLMHGNQTGNSFNICLQHQTFLSPIDTCIAGHCFHFGSVSSFLLLLFVHYSPVAYWAPANLQSSPFLFISFCFFILLMGLSRQECQSSSHFLLPLTTFCQKPSSWPIHVWWSYKPRLVDSLNYTR